MSECLKFLVEIQNDAPPLMPYERERMREEILFYVARLMKFYTPHGQAGPAVSVEPVKVNQVGIPAPILFTGN